MNPHQYPAAIDIVLPDGRTQHIELTPYERLVDKVVRFVAGPERELSIGSDELAALDYDSAVHFEHVIRRRCELGEFILWEDRPGNGFKLEKAAR